MAAHVLAFARRAGEAACLTVVTRLPARALGDSSDPLIPAEAWGETALVLPPALAGLPLQDVLGDAGMTGEERLPLATLLARLPVSLLATG